MTNKLTDAQIALLRSGFERADHCIVVPTGKSASAKKSAVKMIDAGCLKEIKAKLGAPVWRTDETTGAIYSLKLTAAGLKVIAAHDVQASGIDPTASAPSGDEGDDEKQASALLPQSQGLPAIQPTFRQGSKLAAVVALLRREGGVTIDELSETMNWLPHSARAVLTGLRTRGILVARRKTPEGRASACIIETDGVGAIGQA
jgi:Protein of unknown function (DUF3489)